MDILERFYLGEFKFSDDESEQLIDLLHTTGSNRLNEFIFYLVSKMYKFIDRKDGEDGVDFIVNEEKRKYYENVFYSDCLKSVSFGYLSLVKYLFKVDSEYSECLQCAVQYGQLDVLEYLFTFIKGRRYGVKRGRIERDFLFILAAEYGHLHILKYLIESGCKINIYLHNDYAFGMAAKNGHLHILEYLISLGDTHGHVNIHAEDEYAFKVALTHSYFDVVEYLINLEPTHGKINIHADDECAFKSACVRADLDAINYLLSLEFTHGQINIHAGNEYAFRTCVRNSDMHIVKILFYLEDTHGPIDVQHPKEIKVHCTYVDRNRRYKWAE